MTLTDAVLLVLALVVSLWLGPESIIYDVKYILPREAVDGRL